MIRLFRALRFWGRRKSGKTRENLAGQAFLFFSCSFSIQPTRLSRSQEQARLATTSSPGRFFLALEVSAVTAYWASPRFGHPHSQIPSVLGIPVSYYCSVLGIPRYPPGMPKSLVFWSSPPKKFWISRENRKRFGDGFC